MKAVVKAEVSGDSVECGTVWECRALEADELEADELKRRGGGADGRSSSRGRRPRRGEGCAGACGPARVHCPVQGSGAGKRRREEEEEGLTAEEGLKQQKPAAAPR